MLRLKPGYHADPNWSMYLAQFCLTPTHVHVDPAHDLQAMDRAYRFGQTRDVFVYRLLGAGSIEELIYARQLYKQQQMAIGYQASVQTRYLRRTKIRVHDFRFSS